MKRCPHCMQPVSGPQCPYCGKSTEVEKKLSCLPAGTVLKERYELGAVLGRGGFGITYVAWDRENQKKVAVKEYFPAKCTQKERLNGSMVRPMNGYDRAYQSGLASFSKEGKALGEVSYLPSVVHVLDGFQANNTAYIIMEYVEGKTLEKVVKEQGPLKAAVLLPKVAVLMEDLHIMHQNELVHRDISPNNLMWMPDGSLKLIDFGSARRSKEGQNVTMFYKNGFSPLEQYTTRGQGPFTDVYALAATIYYGLTGTIPAASTERLDGTELKSPRELGSDLSMEQEEALLWGLALQPKERPATMNLFARRLMQDAKKPRPQPEPEDTACDLQQNAEKSPVMDTGIHEEEIRGLQETVKEDEAVIPETHKKIRKDSGRVKKLAAVLIAAVAVLLVLLNLPTWLQNSNPVFQTQTEKGMTVEIDRNAQTATLLDVGELSWSSDETLILEDTVSAERYGRPDGNYPIRKIAKGAFQNRGDLRELVLPTSVEVIEDGAFDGCSIDIISISAPLQMDSGAFINGSKLPLIWAESAMETPIGFEAYHRGQDTGFGLLDMLVLNEGGMLLGVTEQKESVILSVPEGLKEFPILDMPSMPIVGILPEVLDSMNKPTVHVLSDSFIYPIELYDKAEWNYDNSPNRGINLGSSWHISVACQNIFRSADLDVEVSEELLRAAHDILLQKAELGSSKTLNDMDWGETLNQWGIKWNNASANYSILYDGEEEELSDELNSKMMGLYNCLKQAKEDGKPYRAAVLVMAYEGEAYHFMYLVHN